MNIYAPCVRNILLKNIKDHALALGYKWLDDNTEVWDTGKWYLYFDAAMRVYIADEFEAKKKTRIMIKQFLKLTNKSMQDTIFDQEKLYQSKQHKDLVVLCTNGLSNKVLFSGVILQNKLNSTEGDGYAEDMSIGYFSQWFKKDFIEYEKDFIIKAS